VLELEMRALEPVERLGLEQDPALIRLRDVQGKLWEPAAAPWQGVLPALNTAQGEARTLSAALYLRLTSKTDAQASQKRA
jgi:hypothetical protein